MSQAQATVNIESYLDSYESLRQAIEGWTEEQLHWKQAEGKWSAAEVLTHLADHNIVVSFRLREILAGSEARLPAFSQDDWVLGQKGNDGKVADILSFYRSLLLYNSLLFNRLTEADWEKTGVNFKGETVTAAAVVRAFIAHVHHHIAQIERIRLAQLEVIAITKEVKIREATIADREAVVRVLLDAYRQYEETLDAQRWEHYRDNILQSIDAQTTRSRLVAEVDGRIVGSVFIYDNSELAYGAAHHLEIHNPIIRLLGVTQEARGSGVATKLIRESARRSLEWGADTLHLHTSDMMDSAIRLYEKLGFERAYDKEFFNGDILVKSYKLRLKETALLQAQ
ncbi:GNAT family N-acetyltransferase [Cohnella soli]|uniref:GNAT family N-acetyltransferase n=1 Tax=Cohnella soli TaxID=425005 RepID=A0ABW0HNT8_9BACL